MANHPLLNDPTEEQANLLEVVRYGFSLTDGVWPNFQYVEAILYNEHGLDATSLLLSCPRQSINGGLGGYGWLRIDGQSWSIPQPADKVELTIAGMRLLPADAQKVETFLAVLSCLVARERPFRPSPTEVEVLQVDSAEISAEFVGRYHHPQGVNPARMRLIGELLKSEPSTWHCNVQPSEAGWVATLTPFLRRYADVTDSADYVSRLIEQIAPPPAAPQVFYPSGLALPEAIDYLNAIWRNHADGPLLRIARAESAAKLALECAGADEFEARLSALCSILDHVALPESPDSKLIDLRNYLIERLDAESSDRTNNAIDDLRAIFDLRAWRQHPGTEARLRKGMRRLGVELPSADWGATWNTVQARCVAALHAIREEVEGLDQPS
jgi:hypothetical protein